MVVCSTGSTVQAGAPSTLNLGIEEIKNIFPTAWSWLGVYIPLIGAIYIDVGAMCALDPPTPSLTLSDLESLLTLGLGAADAAANLRDTILAGAWYRYCQCNAGSGACTSYDQCVINSGAKRMWGMRDAIGSTHPLDLVSNTAIGTYQGSITFQQTAHWSGCQSVLDNGAAGASGIDAPIDFTTAAFTWAGWIKTSTTGTHYLAYYGISGTASGAYIAVVGSHIQVDVITPGNVDQFALGTAVINDGNWHHVAITYDGTNVKGYVDGALDASASAPTHSSTQTHFLIGGQTGGAAGVQFVGNLSDWSTWDRALSGTEIASIYSCGGAASFIPPQPPDPTEPTGAPANPGWTCSTTGDVCGKLQQMDNELRMLLQYVKYIAQNTSPPDYVMGTPVTGLSGAGTIAASGILGVRVSLTTIPSKWGKTGDNPSRYVPSIASIQFVTTDGITNWRDIHYDGQQELSGFGSAVTGIRYNFRPGVIGSITTMDSFK